MTSPNTARRASSPAESQRGARRLTVLANSTLGLAFGLGIGLAFGLGIGLGAGLAFGLGAGLAIKPVLENNCWPAFVVAALWLAARRELPLRLMGFLDDAYRLGLLRIVGPMYQFRHAALQDHLAPPAEAPRPKDVITRCITL